MLNEVQRRVNDLHYGVEIKFIQIQKIGLPESVTQTVFDRMTSERNYYITNVQSQGELAASKIQGAVGPTERRPSCCMTLTRRRASSAARARPKP